MSQKFFRALRIVLVGALAYLLSATLLPQLEHLPMDQNQMISVVIAVAAAYIIHKGTTNAD
jgi:uncharacterized membrane protein YhfC